MQLRHLVLRAVQCPSRRFCSAPPPIHSPVLVDAVVDALKRGSPPKSGPRYVVDATAGTGGHALKILESLEDSVVLCIDRDATAIAQCRKRLAEFGQRARFYVGSYASLPQALSSTAFPPRVHAMLFDLGFGSHQLDVDQRGFSFLSDAPLSMLYDEQVAPGDTRAADILSLWSGAQLEEIFSVYGEEPHAALLARAIVTWRGTGARRRKIQSTLELRYVLEDALAAAGLRAGGVGNDAAVESTGALLGTVSRRAHAVGAPAARKSIGYKAADKLGTWPTAQAREKCLRRVGERRSAYPLEIRRAFMALRVAANDEYGHLRAALRMLPSCLEKGGRLIVLCYQPREQSALLTTARILESSCCSRLPSSGGLGPCTCGAGTAFCTLTPADGIRPSREEVRSNRRARSASMTVIERRCNMSDDHDGASKLVAWEAAMSLALEQELLPVLPKLRALPLACRTGADSPDFAQMGDASRTVQGGLAKPLTHLPMQSAPRNERSTARESARKHPDQSLSRSSLQRRATTQTAQTLPGTLDSPGMTTILLKPRS